LSTSLAYQHNHILENYLLKADNNQEHNREECLAEFSALRNEMLSLLDKRHQILLYTLTAAGVFIVAGVRDIVSPPVILIYPLFSIFLINMWAHIDLRIGQIGDYIRENVEGNLPGLHWENYLRQLYKEQQGKPFKNLIEYYTIGIFFFSQFLAIVIGLFLQVAPYPQVEKEIGGIWNPLLSGVLIILYLLFGLPRMWSIIGMRRKRY
jgi:hypothetical protein